MHLAGDPTADDHQRGQCSNEGKGLGEKSSKVYVITNNHYRGQAMANALQIRNMITGEKVDVPRLLLEKYPVLGEIVRAIRSGQMDLFAAGHRNGEDDKGDTT